MAKKEKCGLTNCPQPMGPGSAEVGYLAEDGEVKKVRVCPTHAWTLMTSPPGSFRITPALKLEPIAVERRIIFP